MIIVMLVTVGRQASKEFMNMDEKNLRTTPRQFLMGSKDFRDAYFSLESTSSRWEELLMVKNFLLARSLELVMKSFLKELGYNVMELKDGKLGHNLEKIMNEIKSTRYAGIFDSYDEEIISLANLHYFNKELEYYSIGAKQLTEPKQLLKTVEKLIKLSDDLIEPPKNIFKLQNN